MSSRMAAEVAEQPARRTPTLESAAAAAGPRVRQLAQGRRQVLFAARGSSDNAADLRPLPARDPGRHARRPALPQRRHPLPGPARPLRRPGRLRLAVRGDHRDRRHPGLGQRERRGDGGGHQRRGLSARRVRRPRAGHAGRTRARGPGHQDLPDPARGDGRPRHRPRTGALRSSTPSSTGCPTRWTGWSHDPQRRRRRGRGAAGRGVRRGLRARPDDGHRARDGPQARGDLPAAGARLLVRRPAARADLGGDRAG